MEQETLAVAGTSNENLRLFARRTGDESNDFEDADHESQTLEQIVAHLVAYVGGIIDVLDANVDRSVLMDPTRPRPELIARNGEGIEPMATNKTAFR